jgi:hypothetical protein
MVSLSLSSVNDFSKTAFWSFKAWLSFSFLVLEIRESIALISSWVSCFWVKMSESLFFSSRSINWFTTPKCWGKNKSYTRWIWAWETINRPWRKK